LRIAAGTWGDAAAYLKTDEDIAHYLEAVFEDGDPSLVGIVGNQVERLRGEFTATSGRWEDLIDQLIVFSFERVNESDTLQCETILQIFGK